MANIVSFIRWGWLLTIALFIPISLPAGGVQTRLEEDFHSFYSSQSIAGNLCEFRVSPSSSSKVLRQISLGTPIKILLFLITKN